MFGVVLVILLGGGLPGAQSYEDLFRDAAALTARGQYAEAAARYEAALKIRPGAAEALSNLAVAYHMSGRYSEAADAARRATRTQPGMAPANLILGLSLIHLNRPAEAAPAFERVLAADPGNRDARLGLASAMVALNRLEAAADIYRRQIATAPRDAEAWYGLAVSYERLGESASRRLSQMPGGAAWSKRFLGEYLLERGNDRLALEAFSEAVGLDPEQPGLMRLYLYAKERVEKPKETIAAPPLVVPPGAGPVAAYAQAREYARLSRESFEKFIGIAPDSWQSLLFHGDLNRQKRDFPEAIRCYEAAAGLQPSSPAPLIGLGTVYWELGTFDKARDYLERALKANPRNVQALFALGDIALRQFRYPDAARLLEAVLRLEPGHAGAHAGLGKAYLRLDRYSDAIPHLEKARAIDMYGDIHFQLATALKKSGHEAQSKTAFEDSRRIRTQQLEREQRLK